MKVCQFSLLALTRPEGPNSETIMPEQITSIWQNTANCNCCLFGERNTALQMCTRLARPGRCQLTRTTNSIQGMTLICTREWGSTSGFLRNVEISLSYYHSQFHSDPLAQSIGQTNPVWKFLVFDRNTWNRITVRRLFAFYFLSYDAYFMALMVLFCDSCWQNHSCMNSLYNWHCVARDLTKLKLG